MQGLRSLRDEAMQAGTQATWQEFPPGNYGYGLNIFLEATSGFIAYNSKRMERRFRLVSVNTANIQTTTNYSLILGTEEFDWFGDFVRAECILGDGVLPHFLPADGMMIERGDSIMVQMRNDEAVAKRIALLFQGEHS